MHITREMLENLRANLVQQGQDHSRAAEQAQGGVLTIDWLLAKLAEQQNPNAKVTELKPRRRQRTGQPASLSLGELAKQLGAQSAEIVPLGDGSETPRADDAGHSDAG